MIIDIRYERLSDGSRAYNAYLTDRDQNTVVFHCLSEAHAEYFSSNLKRLVDQFTVDSIED